MGPPDASCPKEIYDIMSKLYDLSDVLKIKLIVIRYLYY